MSDHYVKHSTNKRSNHQSSGRKPWNNQKSGRGQGNDSKLKEITLPYDFISLPSTDGKPEYYYPYHRRDEAKKPPRHDMHETGHLSGYISYQIKPRSPLVLELRETYKDGGPTEYWLSGSQIRGKLRSNVEVLSASYPEFVDDSEMLYRKINKGERYKQKLGITDDQGLEQAVKAGYLYRDNTGSFYIVPAVMIGEKHFVSIQELDIINMKNNVLPEKNRLFNWSALFGRETMKQVMTKLSSEINKLDDNIRDSRKRLKIRSDHPISLAIQEVFTKDFVFTKVARRIKYEKDGIQNLTSELHSKLSIKLKQYNTEQQLEELFAQLTKRWALKAEMYQIYEGKSVKKTISPYDKKVKYALSGKSVTRIDHASSDVEGGMDGILFNSTNAGSKRAHYLIGREQEDAVRLDVSDSLIISYTKAFERLRLKSNEQDKDKEHYNLFKAKRDQNTEPQVVFYQTRLEKREGNSSEVLVAVGRTPYFKIPYDHQLNKLLGDKDAEGIDYASALFGFVSIDSRKDHDEALQAYKSRLRFSPVRVSGEIRGQEKKFLLSTPQASAGAMYLKANGRGIPTYEGPVETKNGQANRNAPDPSLRGVKFYHVLPQTIPTIPKGIDVSSSMLSQRQVYDPSQISFDFEGEIHFKNLTKAELGLLLLAMDIKLLPDVTTYNNEGKPYYELIGGAKAYGYGKVQFESIVVLLEQQESSFESLVIEPFKAAEVEPAVFVKAYSELMKSDSILRRVDIKRYVQSKLEREFEASDNNHVNWSNMNEVRANLGEKQSGGGYPTDWVLKST